MGRRRPSARSADEAGHGLSPRRAAVLRAVVHGFIRSRGPVASSSVARDARLDVSPATIRVELSRLTDDGLLEQPHTSSGRVPTEAGIRLFVDHLMRVRAPSEARRDALDATLRSAGAEPAALVRAASRHLALACALTALGRRPELGGARLQRLELVPLDGQRVLAVAVASDGLVRHRVVQTPRAYSREELARAQELFGRLGEGTLVELRARLQREIEAAQAREAELLELAADALPTEEAPEEAIIVEGRTHLVSAAEDAEAASRVLRALEDKRVLLDLLDGLDPSARPQVLLGSEPSLPVPLRGCTVVRAAFGVDGRRLGTVAVVGPASMNYSRVVSWVGYTAQTLSGILHTARAA